jgi:hypothetical protein
MRWASRTVWAKDRFGKVERLGTWVETLPRTLLDSSFGVRPYLNHRQNSSRPPYRSPVRPQVHSGPLSARVAETSLAPIRRLNRLRRVNGASRRLLPPAAVLAGIAVTPPPHQSGEMRVPGRATLRGLCSDRAENPPTRGDLDSPNGERVQARPLQKSPHWTSWDRSELETMGSPARGASASVWGLISTGDDDWAAG